MKFLGSVCFSSALLVMVISMAAPQKAVLAAECPCDIYEAAGTPCVGAYSTARQLYSKYTGPLYQVRKTSDNTVKDIPQLPNGLADSKVQDDFLGSGAGTISKLYDQSTKGNYLTVAKKGSYSGTAAQDDKEANAKGKSFFINGHKAYAVYIDPVQGYRNNQENYSGYPAKAPLGNGVPTGNKPQGSYALEDGSRPNVGNACCFNFGTASTDNAAGPRGGMNALFFGICTYWDRGAGSGPWFMVDIEGGVSAGTKNNNNLPSSKFDFAFGLTKNNSSNMTIRVADSSARYNSSPKIVTAFNGNPVAPWQVPGGITLGIGGDNSNSSNGTFYEGCIVSGRPSDTTDDLILKNIRAARYGAPDTTTVTQRSLEAMETARAFKVRYNPSISSAMISFTLPQAQNVTMNVFNQQGKRIATLINGVVSPGNHEAVWNARNVPAGVYALRTMRNGRDKWTGRIVVAK
jgi:non-reducing end alpha-L-arabinofuranosidase